MKKLVVERFHCIYKYTLVDSHCEKNTQLLVLVLELLLGLVLGLKIKK